ncbi:uncharacterized protein C8R40DRAFT_498348 [Lentinula edodes]|uniref:uncharacterized protein n=1 Tax=Lentinula edodes TaxID=5353 RepID=UPI001E8DBE28|nr:uncharacterized protein C8R40DRAFT_498348 [Lentinula edodes]KAH7872375.1 hypothetical protein C8R40DRAFT_498348 [Lentinula edodes]
MVEHIYSGRVYGLTLRCTSERHEYRPAVLQHDKLSIISITNYVSLHQFKGVGSKERSCSSFRGLPKRRKHIKAGIQNTLNATMAALAFPFHTNYANSSHSTGFFVFHRST